MSFLEGMFARPDQRRRGENEADFMARRAIMFTNKVANDFPKSETAMAAELALLCKKNKLEPSELITDLFQTGKQKELIETTRYVCVTQGVGPLDENGEIRVETPEDVVPMTRLLFSYAEDLMQIDPHRLKQLTGMYRKYTTHSSFSMELEYRNAAQWMIYEAEDQRMGAMAT